MCTWNFYFQKNSKRKQKWKKKKKKKKKNMTFLLFKMSKRSIPVETESYNLRRKAFFFKKLNQAVQNNKSQSLEP